MCSWIRFFYALGFDFFGHWHLQTSKLTSPSLSTSISQYISLVFSISSPLKYQVITLRTLKFGTVFSICHGELIKLIVCWFCLFLTCFYLFVVLWSLVALLIVRWCSYYKDWMLRISRGPDALPFNSLFDSLLLHLYLFVWCVLDNCNAFFISSLFRSHFGARLLLRWILDLWMQPAHVSVIRGFGILFRLFGYFD